MYCRNCGKQITNIAEECPFCKTKVNENIEVEIKKKEESETNQQKQQETGEGLDKVLYTGMNGKPVTLWNFIVGIILIILGLMMIF